jgi:predicted lactoylglutathione lyase
MTDIAFLTLEAADLDAAARFYPTLGVADRVRVRPAEGQTAGFRGYTLSLTVGQPADVHHLVDAALAAGATALKPAA